ncbi:hypothetical protein, partial [Actinotalea sp. JY-7885]
GARATGAALSTTGGTGTAVATVPGTSVPLPTGRPTPRRMRLVALGLVAVGVLVGLVGAWSFSNADAALERADANAAQLVRLQELQTRLVSADASATNAFLVGGLEPPDRRAVYDDAMTTAAELVAQAARAQPADGTALAALNVAMLDYAADVEQARAANRQGLPVGAQYLRNASATLRADALPVLAALIEANEDRVSSEFGAARAAWIPVVLVSLLALGAVVAASVWLARRTHRYLNLRLVGAGVVLLVLLVGSTVTLGSVSTAVDRTRVGDFAAASALSRARLAAYDAKANESLTLISRGSGAAFDEAWEASSAITLDTLRDAHVAGAEDLRSAWDTYATSHYLVRDADAAGEWDLAVEDATSDAEDSVNATFAAFDARTADALAEASQGTSDTLAEARSGLGLAVWLAALAGLAVAGLSWTGFARRIEEYR